MSLGRKNGLMWKQQQQESTHTRGKTDNKKSYPRRAFFKSSRIFRACFKVMHGTRHVGKVLQVYVRMYSKRGSSQPFQYVQYVRIRLLLVGIKLCSLRWVCHVLLLNALIPGSEMKHPKIASTLAVLYVAACSARTRTYSTVTPVCTRYLVYRTVFEKWVHLAYDMDDSSIYLVPGIYNIFMSNILSAIQQK